MTEPHCIHEKDWGRQEEKDENMLKSLDRIEKKLDLWNGIPVKVKVLWKFNWVIFVVLILGVIGALFKGIIAIAG